jgi:methylamine dehydrogenase accessory protein MauD
LTARRLDGSPWDYSFPASTDLLLVFISPQCATCNELMPHVRDLARTHSDLDLVLMSTMDDLEMNRAYANFARLGKLTYLLAGEAAARLDIEGTPYAIHLDPQGVVTAKGLVNNYEHLLSLRRPLAPPALGPETVQPEITAETGVRHEQPKEDR